MERSGKTERRDERGGRKGKGGRDGRKQTLVNEAHQGRLKRFPAAVRPANHLSLSLSLPNLSRSYDDDDRGQRLIYRIKRRTIALQVRDFLPLLRMCVNIREGGLFLSFPPDRQIRVTRRVATFHRSLLQFQNRERRFPIRKKRRIYECCESLFSNRSKNG